MQFLLMLCEGVQRGQGMHFNLRKCKLNRELNLFMREESRCSLEFVLSSSSPVRAFLQVKELLE